MIRKFKERLESTIQGEKQLKKQRTELQNQLEELEERYVMKGLEKVLYEKYASKLNTEISKIDDELTNKSFRSSNLEIAVEKCLTIAEKLSQFWVLGNYVIKQKLQYLLFPEGILYDKENDTVRTPKTRCDSRQFFSELPFFISAETLACCEIPANIKFVFWVRTG